MADIDTRADAAAEKPLNSFDAYGMGAAARKNEDDLKKFEEWAKGNNLDVDKSAKEIGDGKMPATSAKDDDGEGERGEDDE